MSPSPETLTLSLYSWSLWAFMAAALFEIMTRAAITRLVWRNILLFFVTMELGAIGLVRRIYPPQFVIRGECHRCGDCCQQIVGDPPKLVKNSRLLNVYTTFHRLAHRFVVTGRGPNDEIIFSCGHLKPDGSCGIYRYRPLLCRNYPLLPYFHPPQLMPNCSYEIAPSVVAQMKSRPSLPIINARVAVHHPSPAIVEGTNHEEFHLVDYVTDTKK